MRFRWPQSSLPWPVGVALGSGLLSNTLLLGSQGRQARNCRIRSTGLTDEKNELNEKLNAAGEFDAQMSPRILRDTMTGKSVVLFRTPDAADDDVEAVTRLVGQAGGTVTGTIALTKEFVDANSVGEAAVRGQFADRACGPSS